MVVMVLGLLPAGLGLGGAQFRGRGKSPGGGVKWGGGKS